MDARWIELFHSYFIFDFFPFIQWQQKFFQKLSSLKCFKELMNSSLVSLELPNSHEYHAECYDDISSSTLSRSQCVSDNSSSEDSMMAEVVDLLSASNTSNSNTRRHSNNVRHFFSYLDCPFNKQYISLFQSIWYLPSLISNYFFLDG